MIKIIKPGNKWILTCPYCGCVFSYEEEDVHCFQTHMNEYEYMVQCPQCKRGVDKNVYYSGNIATDY